MNSIKRVILSMSVFIIVGCGGTNEGEILETVAETEKAENAEQPTNSVEPVDTPTPIPSPVDTPTPIPSPTVKVCNINSPLEMNWKIITCEEFEDQSLDLKTNMDLDLNKQAWIENGKYNILKEAYGTGNAGPDELFFSSSIDSSKKTLFSLDGEVKSDLPAAAWGVTISMVNDEVLRLNLLPNQKNWTIMDLDDVGVETITEIDLEQVITDGVNNITLVTDGSAMSFFLNCEKALTFDLNDGITLQNFYWYVLSFEKEDVPYVFDDLLIKQE